MAIPQTVQIVPIGNNTATVDPFSMISGAVLAEDLPAIMPLRLGIIGPTGEGKSWFADTAPQPILHYDFDNRAASIRGKKGVKVKTLVDSSPANPRAVIELENDLVMLKSSKAAGHPIPATFVLDSALYLKKCMENSLLAQDSDMGKKFKISATKYLRTASAMTSADVIRNYFEYFINEFSSLGHLIVVFHTKDQTDKKKSTPGNPAYTGKFTTEPQYLETILSILNERWRLEQTWDTTTKNMKRIVHTRNDSSFKSITSLDIDDEEEANIEKILAKHKARVEAKAIALRQQLQQTT